MASRQCGVGWKPKVTSWWYDECNADRADGGGAADDRGGGAAEPLADAMAESWPKVGENVLAISLAVPHPVIVMKSNNADESPFWKEGTNDVLWQIGSEVTELDEYQLNQDIKGALSMAGEAWQDENFLVAASRNIIAVGVGPNQKLRVRAARLALMAALALVQDAPQTPPSMMPVVRAAARAAALACKPAGAARRGDRTVPRRGSVAAAVPEVPPPPPQQGTWIWWPQANGPLPPGTWAATPAADPGSTSLDLVPPPRSPMQPGSARSRSRRAGNAARRRD